MKVSGIQSLFKRADIMAEWIIQEAKLWNKYCRGNGTGRVVTATVTGTREVVSGTATGTNGVVTGTVTGT